MRQYELFGKKVQEGIYSPVTQNRRHLNVLKEVRKASKNSILMKHFFEKAFDDNYRSIVVLANPKTCLKAQNAPRDIRKQIIRADQLISYIKRENEASKKYSLKNEEMLELAKFFLAQDKEERSDYVKKYKEMTVEVLEKENREELEVESKEENEIFSQHLITKLKDYRLQKSREENVKPYYIFTDVQMKDLLLKMPKTKEELLVVNGFGMVKVEKYGQQILEILAHDIERDKR